MKLKRFFIFLLFIFMSLTLTSCDPGYDSYEYDYLMDNVVEVKLIYYDFEERESFLFWAINNFDKLENFDFNRMVILNALPDDKMDMFCKLLAKSNILAEYYSYSSPHGKCIMITYESGNFDIVNCDENSYLGYIGTYSPTGEVIDYMGCMETYLMFEIIVDTLFE